MSKPLDGINPDIQAAITKMVEGGKLHEMDIESIGLAAERRHPTSFQHYTARLTQMVTSVGLLGEAWRIRALAAENTIDGIERLFDQSERQLTTREIKARVVLMLEVIASYHEGR